MIEKLDPVLFYGYVYESNILNHEINESSLLKILEKKYHKYLKPLCKEIDRIGNLGNRLYPTFIQSINNSTNDYICKIYEFIDYGCMIAYNGKTTSKDLSKEELLKLHISFINDLIALDNAIKKVINLDKYEKISIVVYFDSETKGTLKDYTKYIKETISKNRKLPKNPPEVFLVYQYSGDGVLNEYNKATKKTKSNSNTFKLKESDKNKYMKMYVNFVKFMQHPHKLNYDIWGGVIKDFCIILDISSERCNCIIAKNMKPIGSKSTINPKWFMDEPEYGEKVSKDIGYCYFLENGDGEDLVYSISKKKCYVLNYEHNTCEEFYKGYSSDIQGLEEVLYGYNDGMKNILKNLFEEYNKTHNIKVFE